jgi:hypothetical protein
MTFRPTIQQARFLASEKGDDWLAKAAERPFTSQSMMADLQILRRSLTADMAAAVTEQVLLRRRGQTKFSRAGEMLFVGEALEQATDSRVARHRARRFRSVRCVADLGCGIGGDSLALAGSTDMVLALDQDPVRLIFARHNAAVYNLADKIIWVQADLLNLPAPLHRLDAAFADPARRSVEGKRAFSPRDYHPPLQALLSRFAACSLAVKVGPGLDFSSVPTAAEIESVSLNGEAKEAVLWFRDLATPGVTRRATCLPSGTTITDAQPDDCPLEPLASYLYEPDPAIIRAGLVKQVGARLKLSQIDPHIAFLSGDTLLNSDLVTAYQIEARLPLKIKLVNRYLQQNHISHVNIKQRGTGLSPDMVAAKLKPAKDGLERTLILVRIKDDHFALIAK